MSRKRLAVQEGRFYGPDQRGEAGDVVAPNKHHVRFARDCRSDTSDRFVIKGSRSRAEDTIGRFRDEVAGMQRLSGADTSGVLPLIDSCSTEDELWYVMPHADMLADELELEAATTPLTRNDGEREWIGERVL